MAIFGIDLGAASSVIATIGKREVTIVRNDLADRLTPTLVSYTDKERLIGDAALSSLTSNLPRTVQYFKNLLGAVDDKSCERLKKTENDYAFAKIVSHEGVLAYDVGRDAPVTPTEVLACYLKRLRVMGEAYIGAECPDVVIAVPSWFTDVNRAAVLDACTIAGLTCYRVMSHTAATALNYGLFRSASFQPGKKQVVAFVDIGASAASVTLAEFQPDSVRIVGVEERTDLGGRSLDYLLIQHIAKTFKSKTDLNVFSNHRATLKVALAAEKAKKILSANREAPINIEPLMGDEDYDALVTREQFESLASEYARALESLIQSTIQKSGIPLEEITSVEIVGGGVRVPFVQTTIERVFGRAVSRTVSADECVARGAAVMGAMFHPCHRVKDFRVIDIRTSPVHVTVSPDAAQLVHEMVKDVVIPMNLPQDNTFTLFDVGSRSHCIFWLIFQSSVASLPQVKFDLRTINNEGAEVPLGTFEVVIPEKISQLAVTADPSKARFKVRFESNIHGIVQVSAFFVEDYYEKQSYQATKDVPNEAGEMVSTQVEEFRDVVKHHKTALPVNVQRPLGWATAEELERMQQRELMFAEQDAATEKARHVANEILSTCFRIRQELDTVLRPFATPEDQQVLKTKSHEWEEWVEEHHEASYEEILPIWDEIQQNFGPIEERKRTHDEELRRREEEENQMREAAEAEQRQQEEAAAGKAATDNTSSSPQPDVDVPMEEVSPKAE